MKMKHYHASVYFKCDEESTKELENLIGNALEDRGLITGDIHIEEDEHDKTTTSNPESV
jgi:hypothetical protein